MPCQPCSQDLSSLSAREERRKKRDPGNEVNDSYQRMKTKIITRCLQRQILPSLLQLRDKYNAFHRRNTFINFSVLENNPLVLLVESIFALFILQTNSFFFFWLFTLFLLIKALLQLFHFGLFFLYCLFKLTNTGLLKFNKKGIRIVDYK